MHKDVVGSGKMAAAEEAAVGRQWRGVWRRQHMVAQGVDELALGDGMAAPKEEHDARTVFVEGADGGIGEGLPAVALVAAGLVGAHGEGGVEQQHALFGPAAEVAVGKGYVGA